MTNRQQLIRNIIGRARAAMAWFLLVIVLVFAALAHVWQPHTLNALLFAIGIGAAIGITRLWNLLDEAHELEKLKSVPAPAVAPYNEDPSAYQPDPS